MVLYVLLAASGCIPIPLDFNRPLLPQDMEKESREKIVSEGWTREQVLAALGEPNA